MARTNPDLIEACLNLMSEMPAPPNFKLAGVITALSSLLGRRVWIDTEAELPRAYPNLYTMLVAPPGVAKDNIIKWIVQLLSDVQHMAGPQRRIVAFSGSSISPKAVYDALASQDTTEQTFTYNKKVQTFRSLTFCVPELSTMMTEYNQQLVGILNELYNCSPEARDRIRGQDYLVPNPHVVLLLGNQPATLYKTMPEETFHMGFPSRCCIFQANASERKRLFNLGKPQAASGAAREQVLLDLYDVTLMSGPFRITEDVGEWLNAFNIDNPDPVPGSKWDGYNSRRILHVQKLAMICSASERSDRTIELRHCERALEIMRSYEQELPQLFEGVVSSRGYSSSYEQTDRIIEQLAKPVLTRGDGGAEVLSHYEITHWDLARELARTHALHEKEALIKELIQSGRISLKLVKVEGQPAVPFHPRTYVVRAQL